jgi:NRPS condensation-like uncharacterized protein
MAKEPVKVINDKGGTMMSMSQIGREDDHMTVVGSLMGAWESTMYVSPEDVLRMMKLMINWKVIGYVLTLPIILYRYRKNQEDDD